MPDRLTTHRRRLIQTTAVLSAACFFLVQSAGAQKLEKLDASLKWIPEDAAFYSSALRNREQFEAVAESRAVARLSAMPVSRESARLINLVQTGWQLYKDQAGQLGNTANRIRQIELLLEDPQVRRVLDLVADMLSREVFIYGDADCVQSVELAQRLAQMMRYRPAVSRLTGQADQIDEPTLQGRLLLRALVDHLDLVTVPNLVVGFKVSDTNRAAGELGKLELIVNLVALVNPQLRGRVKRTKLGDYDYLTLAFDGTLIPWNKLPVEKLRQLETRPGDVDKLIARVTEQKLVIALGLRDDYLLVSIGSSTDHLAALGQGKRLIDRPELKPLEEFAGRRLTSIRYVSKPMRAATVSGRRCVDDMLSAMDDLLPLAEMGARKSARIRNEAATLADDLKRWMPDAGAITACTFLTDRGIEGYTFDWGDHGRIEGSRPLELLEHVGGRPLAAVAFRTRILPGDYDLAVKWLKTAGSHVEEYAVKKMDAQTRKRYRLLVALIRPLAEQIDRANREVLLPALADGQGMLVFDGELSGKEALPLPAPALVLAVCDTKRLCEACKPYREIYDALVDVLCDSPPESKVTRAKTEPIRSYSLSGVLGVDVLVVPNVGWSDRLLVFSLSPDHTRRLLGTTPLEIGGVLADRDRQRIAAAFFDWAGLIDAVTPRIEQTARKIVERTATGDNPDTVKARLEILIPQVRTLLDVLKVVRTMTSECYLDGGALVRHTLVEIRDVE